MGIVVFAHKTGSASERSSKRENSVSQRLYSESHFLKLKVHDDSEQSSILFLPKYVYIFIYPKIGCLGESNTKAGSYTTGLRASEMKIVDHYSFLDYAIPVVPI